MKGGTPPRRDLTQRRVGSHLTSAAILAITGPCARAVVLRLSRAVTLTLLSSVHRGRKVTAKSRRPSLQEAVIQPPTADNINLMSRLFNQRITSSFPN